MKKGSKRYHSPQHFADDTGFAFPGAFGSSLNSSFIVHFGRGRFRIQLVNPRLTTDEVAQVLHTDPDGVSHLVRDGLLKPLGQPTKNKQRFFFTDELMEDIRDKKWMSKVTNSLYRFGEARNVSHQDRRRLKTVADDAGTGNHNPKRD